MIPAVLGQNAALARLKRMLEAEKVPSALLFWGPEGVGKRTAARAFAAALQCGQPTLAVVSGPVGRPLVPAHPARGLDVQGLGACGACRDCGLVAKRSHADVAEVDWEFQAAVLEEPVEKQQHLRIETVRELTRRASMRSGSGGWKVFIVDNAHLLTPDAANALLKVLEEPAARTLWVLVTSRKSRLLPTVRSRCQAVPFRPLTGEVLLRVLADSGLLDAALAARWAPAAGGSVTAAVRLAAHGGIVDDARRDPAAYYAAAQTLPRELAAARETVEGVIDCLLADTREEWRRRGRGAGETARRLLGYRRAVRQNVSPQLVLQLALLDTEKADG